MAKITMKTNNKQPPRLLVFSCHEAWIHQLRAMDYDLDLIVGLKGRKTDWDTRMRPLPPRARLITLEQAQCSDARYHCIIAHNITDLLDAKNIPGPRLLILHSTIEGRAMEENSDITPEQMRLMTHKYLEMVGGHAAAVSQLKARSWEADEDMVVLLSADTNDYLPYSGEKAAGLRISNDINKRPNILMWDLHQSAFADLPVTIVGNNPDMPGVKASDSWDDLKNILQAHRFYIHTAQTDLEDGYNTATLEAMAAGLPVLGNVHPTSPIIHGVSGFLSDDPAELKNYAIKLLEDRDLAAGMGEQARLTVQEKFSPQQFTDGLNRAIETARRKHHSHRGGQ